MQLQIIIQECKTNSITAQKCLYNLLSKQMFLLCRRYVKNDFIAEEILSNGFVKTFHSISTFTFIDDAKTIAFIKRVMVNECLQYLRKNDSFLSVALDTVPETLIDGEIFSTISIKEIYLYILQLPTGYKTVFNLFEIEGYSHKEIAELLQISEGTSKSQLSKAKKMLQDLIIKNNNLYETRNQK